MTYSKCNKKIAIIDLGLGNIFSLYESLKINFSDVTVIRKLKENKQFNVLIIPGVGTFKQAMKRLKKNFPALLKKKGQKDNVLIIGVCLGMQILYQHGYEEGLSKGLGYLDGNIIKLKSKKLIIPNIGWRNIKIVKNKKYNFLKKYDQKSFYFCHSYYAKNYSKNKSLGYLKYDNNYVPCLVINENIIGIQFHPEKSRDQGINLLKDLIINHE